MQPVDEIASAEAEHQAEPEAQRTGTRRRLKSLDSNPGLLRVWGMPATARARGLFSRENGGAMTLQELRTTKRDEILLIAARRGARNVRVFGSVARGDDDERSDIDFLVDLEPDRSLFDLSGLLIDLEAALHSQVDVVTERGLRPRIRDRALREAVPL